MPIVPKITPKGQGENNLKIPQIEPKFGAGSSSEKEIRKCPLWGSFDLFAVDGKWRRGAIAWFRHKSALATVRFDESR
jgi:hypothetical protein